MNIAVDPAQLRDRHGVAIIGAGPYGLAVAAHLRAANVPFRIFGEALSFWRSNMPRGMTLRSPWIATHIADPARRYRLDDYYRLSGMAVPKVLPRENFVDYGLWFREQVAPDLDTRAVTRVEAFDGGFRLMLEDGDSAFARRVVMAAGLRGHEFRPAQFDAVPRALITHSSEHMSYEEFRGRRVAVIGRGLSACEAAAFLHEAGAEVEMICRGKLSWSDDPGKRGALRKAVRAVLGNALIPPSQVGSFPYGWLNELPGLIHRMSQAARDHVNARSLGATTILSIRPRLKDVALDQGRTIFAARKVGDGVSLTLDSATKRYDHVVLATGYRIDVDHMTMLEPGLREKIARHGGLPALNGEFESSVPGLHFAGAAAVASFGPLLRFIAGTGFAARRIARAARHGAEFRAHAEPAALSLAAERNAR